MRLNVFRLYHNYWCLKPELPPCEALCNASLKKAPWYLSRYVRRHREPLAVLLRPAIGVAPMGVLAVGGGIAGGGVDDGEVAEHADLDIMRREIADRYRRCGLF